MDSISVKTQFGELVATTTPSIENHPQGKPNDTTTYYPGIDIAIIRPNGERVTLCVIESPSDTDQLNTYLYMNPNSDDYTSKHSLTQKDFEENPS